MSTSWACWDLVPTTQACMRCLLSWVCRFLTVNSDTPCLPHKAFYKDRIYSHSRMFLAKHEPRRTLCTLHRKGMHEAKPCKFRRLVSEQLDTVSESKMRDSEEVWNPSDSYPSALPNQFSTYLWALPGASHNSMPTEQLTHCLAPVLNLSLHHFFYVFPSEPWSRPHYPLRGIRVCPFQLLP